MRASESCAGLGRPVLVAVESHDAGRFAQIVPVIGGIVATILQYIGVQDFILLAWLQVEHIPHHPAVANNQDRC